MIDKAQNCLIEIDFFGKFYYFTFNKETRFTSACGGILSMCVVLGFLIAMWFLGNEIIFKTTPTVVFNYNLDQVRYNRPLNVPFGFVIENIDGLVLDNYSRYFTFSAMYINFSKADYTKEFSIIRQNIPMRPCVSTDFSNDPIIQKSFNDNNLRYGFCLENLNQTIGGSWGSFWNFYVNVTLEPCRNLTTNAQVCASEEEINTFIMGRQIQVSMYYEDMILTTTNNINPLTKYMKNDHHRIQLNTAKINEYFLQDVSVRTDNGWLVPSKSNLSTQIFTSRFQDFYNNNNQYTDKKVIGAISFNFFASEYTYEVLRSYLKIQDVLAQLGGILKVVFMAFEGFLYLVYSHKHEEILLRNFYNLKDPEKIKKNSLKTVKNDFFAKYNIKPTKINKNNRMNTNDQKKEEAINLNVPKGDSILNNSNQLFLNNNIIPNFQTKLNIEETQKYETEKQNEFINNKEVIERVYTNLFEKKKTATESMKVFFSYNEIIFLLFCPCLTPNETKKKEIYFKSLVEYTKKYSDGLSIIRSVNEMEKLKSIIFDEKQLALLNLVAQPKNPLENCVGEFKPVSFNKEKMAQLDVARNYLAEIRNKRNLNFIETKLIELYQK